MGDRDDDIVRWTATSAETFLQVGEGPDGLPDLGVLRIETPVATVVDAREALESCNALNTWGTTSRWIIAPSRDADNEVVLSLTCEFVVGPHNQADLEAFVAECVRGQVATATPKLTSDFAAQFGGEPCHPRGSRRPVDDWHEAAYHYEQAAKENSEAEDLAIHLQRAFLALRDEMKEEGTGAWYSEDPTSYPLGCEMPATWLRSARGDIYWDPDQPNCPPTASVKASFTPSGDAGNGLLISLYAVGYCADTDDVVNQLNRLNEQAKGATHWIGAWTRHENDPIYLVFLPAALLADEDINWPTVMREILLTFTRQSQLARRVVFDEHIRMALDKGIVQPVGLEAARKPHGLAWGETGEGRNPSARYLDLIFDLLVGQDSTWAYPADGGFVWWPYQQAQYVTVTDRGAKAGLQEVVRIRVATEVRADVPRTDETLTIIARRNATLPESALVLDENGTLLLAFQLVITETLEDDAEDWLQDLAIRQFITARGLAEELAPLGAPSSREHPVAGPRPTLDVWFEQYPAYLKAAAEENQPEQDPQVALIAAAGGYALPYRMTANDDGSLQYSWRPEHTPSTVPADPEIRVTLAPGADKSQPAWIIHSQLPLTGSEAEKARWCNDRNTERLLDPASEYDGIRVGGWGLSLGGECCLTTGQVRQTVRGNREKAAQKLGYLLREEQSDVLEALSAAPEMVREAPLTPDELVTGLGEVRVAFDRLLGERQDRRWSVEPLADGAHVTCGELAMKVPTGYGRAQLALVYGELLVTAPNGSPWLSLYAPFPGSTIDLALGQLETAGLLWEDEKGRQVFDAGHTRAELEMSRVRFGTEQGLRVVAVPDDTSLGRFAMTIPPAQFAWDIQPAAIDVLKWVVLHVIAQAREAAIRRAQTPAIGALPVPGASQLSSPPQRPRLFGSGRYAASALRARLLRLLGAESEWLIGDHDAPEIIWNSGLATTVFEVSTGADNAPDLGVLRVYTPVATARNGNAARDVCAQLNNDTFTARWSVSRERDSDGSYYDEVQVSCAFVVGPHNQDTLESFAFWCVREQIAAATGQIRSGNIAAAAGGGYSHYVGFPGGDERADWNPVTSFLADVVESAASMSTDTLADEWLAAFRALRQRMFSEAVSTWFAAEDAFPLTFEVPFGWGTFPEGVITRLKISDDDDPDKKPKTALVESVLVEHERFGEVLRIAVHVPRDPRGNVGRALNDINRLDVSAPGVSHSFGGWIMSELMTVDGTAAGLHICLPAAFAQSVAHRPLVMQEILLTLVRQALLSRRALLSADELDWPDGGPRLGLAAGADAFSTTVRGQHGLAWGETGEGRNPAARVLDQLYDHCVGPDADWAVARADGFTWWPYHQAQDVTAELHHAGDVVQGVSVRIATEVRRAVPVTPAVLRAIASVNADLGQSTLVLDPDGLLYLACRFYVHEGTDHWARRWAQWLMADQFIKARELSARFAALGEFGGFGEEAVSAHPFSGLRPSPDELFGVTSAEWAGKVQTGLAPLVPLIGLCSPYVLPADLSVADDAGGLDFTWYVSQWHAELPVDSAIRVSVRQQDIGGGPGWLIRTAVDVTGDADDKARWANDRNSELLSGFDDSSADQTTVGGWGVTGTGECCLTTWISPFFVDDEITMAAGLVGNLLKYQQFAALPAIVEHSDQVIAAPARTPEELTRGLTSVLGAFAKLLEYPDGFRWTVEPIADAVLVTLTGPASAAVRVAVAASDDSGLRTVLRIPLTRNRPQLALLYLTFLSWSVASVRSFSTDLIPGENGHWRFSADHINAGLGTLDDEGMLTWHKAEGAFTFDAGPGEGWLRFEFVKNFRPYDGMALRLTATIPDLDLSALRRRPARDATVLGSWEAGTAGLSYSVTIPPAAWFFGSEFIVSELVTWVARHIVTHIRQSL